MRGSGSEALEVGWSGGGVRGLDTICLMYFVDGIRILALALFGFINLCYFLWQNIAPLLQ